MHGIAPVESAAAVAFHARAAPTHAPRCQRPSTIARTFRLTIRFSMPPLLRPVRLRCFREALRWQDGMRRPAGLRMHANSREASGNTALPPLRAERANAPMRDQGHRSCAPPNRLAKAGPEPTTAAVERREASVPAGTQGARWRLRAYVTGPPTGAAAPERLSALRSPHFGW